MFPVPRRPSKDNGAGKKKSCMNNKVKKKFATNDKLSNHGLQGQGCPSPDVLLNVVRILQYNYRYLDNPYPGSQISKFKYDLLKQKKSY